MIKKKRVDCYDKGKKRMTRWLWWSWKRGIIILSSFFFSFFFNSFIFLLREREKERERERKKNLTKRTREKTIED